MYLIENAMGRIAELIKECIIDKKSIKEEVNRFRAKYRRIKYNYGKHFNKSIGSDSVRWEQY